MTTASILQLQKNEAMPQEMLEYEFMRNALIAALLSSIACGIIGSFVVVKKIGYISGGIAHTAFGGIGLGYFLGVNPLLGVLPVSIVSALAIGLLSRKSKVAEDSAIGAFWAVGMAAGVILIGLTPGYAPNLFSYLFGNILTVPSSDLLLIFLLDLLIVSVVILLYNEFFAVSFDEEYAEVSGLRTTAIYLLLLCLIALTVVIMMRIVGIVMVIALLGIPAATARSFSRSLPGMMLLSSCLSSVFSVVGLWLSYVLNLASGATIIIVAGLFFLIVQLVRGVFPVAGEKREGKKFF